MSAAPSASGWDAAEGPRLVELLLREQAVAQDGRLGRGHADVERAAPPQVRDVRGTDHDLGRHAADIDAGAADRAAFDERDPRAALGRFERRGHRGAAAADDGNMQHLAAAAFLLPTANQWRALSKKPSRDGSGAASGTRAR